MTESVEQLTVERDWLLAEADDDTRARFFAARRAEAGDAPTVPGVPAPPLQAPGEDAGHCTHWRDGDGPCCRCRRPSWLCAVGGASPVPDTTPEIASGEVQPEYEVDGEASTLREAINAAAGFSAVSTKGCRRRLDALRAAFPDGGFDPLDEDHQRRVAVASGAANAGPTARSLARMTMIAVAALEAAGASQETPKERDHG